VFLPADDTYQQQELPGVGVVQIEGRRGAPGIQWSTSVQSRSKQGIRSVITHSTTGTMTVAHGGSLWGFSFCCKLAWQVQCMYCKMFSQTNQANTLLPPLLEILQADET
jgi:hypothetical protein